MKEYLNEVQEVTSSIDLSLLESAINLIEFCSDNNGTVFLMGNGGSAAIASHFATDLIKSGYVRQKPIKAISLVDNLPLLTATANDFSYEDVFAWQLKQFASDRDLLFAISSSGNSENVKFAVSQAKANGIRTITLSGFDGGAIAKSSDISLITKSKIGSYGPVEDSHSIVCHYIALELRKL